MQLVKEVADHAPITIVNSINPYRLQCQKNAASWDKAVAAQQDSGGWFDEFSDEEILAAQKLLAEKEGIFCEPASAISIVGAIKDIKNGKIPEGSVITCTLTGHGLKDPDTAIRQSTAPLIKVKAELEEVKAAILQNMN